MIYSSSFCKKKQEKYGYKKHNYWYPNRVGFELRTVANCGLHLYSIHAPHGCPSYDCRVHQYSTNILTYFRTSQD